MNQQWQLNDYTMYTTMAKLLQVVSYTHKAGQTTIAWTHTAESMT